MPIHDQSYRRYGGGRVPRGRAWTVVMGAGLRGCFRKRVFIALLLLSWLPFLVRAVQLYAAANFPQMALFAPTAETFRQFLDQQSTFVFFVTVFAGAGLVANDRRANALQIYLSKPMTRAEYVFGKFAVLAILLLMVTWLPAMMLLVVQMVFSGSTAFLGRNLYLVPAITLLSLVEAVMVSAAMLALSSLSRNSRFVGILYAGLIFFTDALSGVLGVVTRDTGLAWVSFSNDLAQLGDAIFRIPPRYAMPWPVALVMVLVLVAASAAVLERRVRGVEVVS